MNVKKVAISTLLITAALTLVSIIMNGMILDGLYQETSSLWRSHEEITNGYMYIYASRILFGFGISSLLDGINAFSGKSFNPLQLGWAVGTLFGGAQIMQYALMPIPMGLMLGWVVTWIMNGLAAGVVMKIMNSCCCSDKC